LVVRAVPDTDVSPRGQLTHPLPAGRFGDGLGGHGPQKCPIVAGRSTPRAGESHFPAELGYPNAPPANYSGTLIRFS